MDWTKGRKTTKAYSKLSPYIYITSKISLLLAK